MQEEMFDSASEEKLLPVMLTATDIQKCLGISRAGTYKLLRSKGFPSLKIGKRIVVPQKDFLLWIDQSISA